MGVSSEANAQKTSIVAIPAAMSRICRIEEASVRPRWSPGIKSAMATYRKLAAAIARKYGSIRGTMSNATKAATAPTALAADERTLRNRGPAARIARMQEDGEVADLLRDFVGRHGHRGADAKRYRRHHGGCHDGTVHEVVKGVADQHRKHAAFVYLTVMRVAVPPENEFLEDKEQQDTKQQRREDARGRELLETGRQQREHGDTEQRADRVADEPRNQLRTGRVANEEDAGGNEQTAEPTDQAQTDGDK